LPFSKNNCISCAAEFAYDSKPSLHCGTCTSQPPPFEITVSAFQYKEPIRYLIRAFKYHSNYAAGHLLGSLLKNILQKRTELPQRIIPVPLHSGRYRARGFNQAAELAKPIARALNMPLELKRCRRIRQTVPQASLHANLREKNIRNAFEVTEKIPADYVAIIDDVVTTGATVKELSRTLINSGIKRIEIWTCAKA